MLIKPDKEKTAPARTAFQNNLQDGLYQTIAPTQGKNAALEESLRLAEQSISSFPCGEDKKPRCPHGFKDATTNFNALKKLWQCYSGELVGVPTGAVSGLAVLDIDPRHGGNDWLDANFPRLPATRIHQTRSGGVHILFKHKEGLRNSAGKIAAGVDVRANGGYIIWWPAAGLPVACDAPFADWPEWLLPIPTLSVPRTPFMPDASMKGGSTYARAALLHAAKRVATAPDGCRNDTLNREAWSLLRFAKSGELCIQTIFTTLAAAGISAGLREREIIATLTSTLRAWGIA
jgi:hypothetical protein